MIEGAFMDPGTGNIYTAEQAEALGLDLNGMIPLEEDEVASIFLHRQREAKRFAIAKEHKPGMNFFEDLETKVAEAKVQRVLVAGEAALVAAEEAALAAAEEEAE
jgi:hypothetical protein